MFKLCLEKLPRNLSVQANQQLLSVLRMLQVIIDHHSPTRGASHTMKEAFRLHSKLTECREHKWGKKKVALVATSVIFGVFDALHGVDCFAASLDTVGCDGWCQEVHNGHVDGEWATAKMSAGRARPETALKPAAWHRRHRCCTIA